MPLWVWLALATGCAQTARNTVARSMVGEISAPLNSWARFVFMLLWLLPLVAFFVMRSGMPQVSPLCLSYAVLAAASQLIGGVLLIIAFQHANFTQSVIFYKLEVAFSAVIGVLFFQESPSLLAWLGILICSVGVVLMNMGREVGPGRLVAGVSPRSWRCLGRGVFRRPCRLQFYPQAVLTNLGAGQPPFTGESLRELGLDLLPDYGYRRGDINHIPVVTASGAISTCTSAVAAHVHGRHGQLSQCSRVVLGDFADVRGVCVRGQSDRIGVVGANRVNDLARVRSVASASGHSLTHWWHDAGLVGMNLRSTSCGPTVSPYL
ncbi:hypothetical protein C2W62_16785 [Candidatus Entotheonella serta]|nr:hypothetical protein C2W62_16785 [Candidatus Entotheonella serta]